MLHETAGGTKGKIGWRDTVSRTGLKNYAFSITFPNILKVKCHGKYTAIIKLEGRERKTTWKNNLSNSCGLGRQEDLDL